jgi:hypothetical protein
MSRIMKGMAVALLVAAGLAVSSTTASAVERGRPVQTAYRIHRGGYHGGYYGGWYGGYYPGGWYYHNHRWYRR